MRLLLIAGAASVLTVAGGRVFAELGRPRERGILVAGMVREQLQTFSQAQSPAPVLSNLHSWPDDFVLLQSWLILKTLKERNPDSVVSGLKSISHGKRFSSQLRTTLDRWNEAMGRWSRSRRAIASPVPSDLLMDGRQSYFEGVGYRKIGRSYDGTPYFLWAIDSLTRFIETAPADARVPEALYLLGASYFNLRNAIPENLRSDRVLHLCSEFFVDSIWTTRANSLWRNGSHDEI